MKPSSRDSPPLNLVERTLFWQQKSLLVRWTDSPVRQQIFPDPLGKTTKYLLPVGIDSANHPSHKDKQGQIWQASQSDAPQNILILVPSQFATFQKRSSSRSCSLFSPPLKLHHKLPRSQRTQSIILLDILDAILQLKYSILKASCHLHQWTPSSSSKNTL